MEFARPSKRLAVSASTRHGGVRDRLLFALMIVAWGAACIGASLLAPVLARLLPAGRRAAVGQAGIRLGFRAMTGLMQSSGLFRFDSACLEALQVAPPLVIAANHPSLLDAVIVNARLHRTVCIAKPALRRNPLVGGAIRLAGYPCRDTPLALVRSGVDALRQGSHLLVFPEGTRTAPGHSVQGFRGGFALMARTAGVAVQTVLIETDTPYLAKGWPLFRMPPLPVVYRVRLGRRFEVEGGVHDFVADLERYFQAELHPA